jgi:pimeloyl-ACP methyl ester carboxylesterase
MSELPSGRSEAERASYAFTLGRRVKTGPISTYVETYGEGEAVFLIHGDPLTLDTMRAFHVLASEFQVVFYDRRGLGRTEDTDDDWTYRDLADDLRSLMDALEVPKGHIIGHSGGADVGLEFATAYPDRITSLVSIGANYDNTWAVGDMARAMEAARPSSWLPEFDAINRALSPDGPERYDEVFRKLRRLWLEYPKFTLEDLARIHTPTLVVAGDHDMIDFAHTVRLYEALPDAELLIFPGTEHFHYSVKPDLVLPIIREFLVRHRGSL